MNTNTSPIGLDGIQNTIESYTHGNMRRDPDSILIQDSSPRVTNSRKDCHYASDNSSSRDSGDYQDRRRRKRKRTIDDIEDRYHSYDQREMRKEKKHKKDSRKERKYKRDDREERKHDRRGDKHHKDDRKDRKHKKHERKERKQKRRERKERKHKRHERRERERQNFEEDSRHSRKNRYESDGYNSDSSEGTYINNDRKRIRSQQKKRQRSDSSCEKKSYLPSTFHRSSPRSNLQSSQRQITPMSPSFISKKTREGCRSSSNDSMDSRVYSSFNRGTKNAYIEPEWETQNSLLQSKRSSEVPEGSYRGSTPTSSETIHQAMIKNECSNELQFKNDFEIPNQFKSINILSNESYIKGYMNEYTYASDNDDLNINSNLSPVVQGIYKVLIDVMAFQCVSSERIYEVQPMPNHMKPVQTVSSVQDFVILQALTQNWKEHSTCCFMEEFAFAFRLAAHIILKSNESARLEKLVEAKKRGLVTLLRSLRGCYSLIQQKIYDFEAGCPVKDNIQNFFSVPSKCSFSKAQILLLDIVPLLTDGAESIGLLGSKRSKAVLENLLKLDSVSLKRKIKTKEPSSLWSFNDGLIELFIRQLLHQENDDSLKIMIENISITESESIAYVCVSENISSQCYYAVTNVRKMRRVQLERIAFISDHNINLEMTNSVLEGCSYLSRLYEIMRHSANNSDRRLASFLSHVQQNDTIAHMAFYFFHMVMAYDITADQGGLHAKSVYRPDNLSSVVLASLLLASKCVESPISLKNLIMFSNMMEQDISANVSKNIPLSKPMEELVKTYEMHIQSLFGFDLPLASVLPYSFINDIVETFCLDLSEIPVLRQSFLDVGVTHSNISLLGTPKLVAFATCYYASNHLQKLSISPAWKSNISEKEKDAIISIADYMKHVSLFFENNKKAIDSLVPIEKPSIQRLICILNNQIGLM